MVNMKRLWVARHAEAIGDHDDFNRILSVKGYRQAVNIGKEIASYQTTIDEIWASSATRTLSTAQLFADQVGFDKEKIESSKDLYNASVRILLQTVNNHFQEDSNNILLVGHNPYISYLVEVLTGTSFEGLQTSQVAILESDKAWCDWSEKTATFKTLLGGVSEED